MPGTPGPSPLITKSSSPPALKFVLVLGLVLAGLAVVAFSQSGDDPENFETAASSTVRIAATPEVATTPAVTAPPEPVPAEPVPAGTELIDPATTETAPVATEPPATLPDVVDGAPAGVEGGDAAGRVPEGMIADIGDGWRMQVLGVQHDATEAVLERNQFNDPPPDGSRYTLVNVALGYYGPDDPTGAFTTTIDAVGAGDPTVDRACGAVIPDDLEEYDLLFTGGVVRGNLCFVTTPADAEVLQLAASGAFGLPSVRLAASATPADPSDLPTLRGPQPNAAATPDRTGPVPIGESTDVGGGWTVTITTPARDVTDEVLSHNQFNDPPPDGSRFVGVSVVYEYNGDEVANGFDIVARAVGDTNREARRDCGVIPNRIDPTADIANGDVVVGDVCFVVPVDDLDTVVLLVSANFTSDARYFATQ